MSENNQVNDQTTADQSMPYFSVRDIHAYYAESYIVQGVSFDVNEKEILELYLNTVSFGENTY